MITDHPVTRSQAAVELGAPAAFAGIELDAWRVEQHRCHRLFPIIRRERLPGNRVATRHVCCRFLPSACPEAAVEIIAANPWTVSCTDEAPLASDIPVILDCEGEPGARLLGPRAGANPHSRLLSWRGRFSTQKLSTIGPELGPEQA